MKNTHLVLAASLCAAALPCILKADSTWIIKPVSSASGRMQVFTSRATSKTRPLMVQYTAPADGRSFKRMRFGDKNKFAYAGINEHGLAVLFSGTDATRDRPSKPTGKQPLYTGSYIVEALLAQSKTVGQASEKLRKMAKSGYIAGGLIVFIVDANHPMIFEISPRNYASRELGLLYTVYANRWKMPGMEAASSRMPWQQYSCLQEEWVANTGILNARRNDRKVSIPESIAIARTNAADVNREGIAKAPSTRNSLDGFIFEIDPAYPGILSCVYASFGPPRHTVFLPIPVGAMDALPPEVVNAEWSAVGEKLNKTVPESTPVSADLPEFEKYLFQEFDDARHQAELLLKEGKTEEAKELLRETLKRQAAATSKFMNGRK